MARAKIPGKKAEPVADYNVAIRRLADAIKQCAHTQARAPGSVFDIESIVDEIHSALNALGPCAWKRIEYWTED